MDSHVARAGSAAANRPRQPNLLQGTVGHQPVHLVWCTVLLRVATNMMVEPSTSDRCWLRESGRVDAGRPPRRSPAHPASDAQLDVAAWCRHLVPDGSVHAFLADHRAGSLSTTSRPTSRRRRTTRHCRPHPVSAHPEQVGILLAATRYERRPWLRAFTIVAAATGARTGELCGLEWHDLDLEAGTLRFRQAVLSLPAFAVDALRDYQQVRRQRAPLRLLLVQPGQAPRPVELDLVP
jgi:Phage integrase family